MKRDDVDDPIAQVKKNYYDSPTIFKVSIILYVAFFVNVIFVILAFIFAYSISDFDSNTFNKKVYLYILIAFQMIFSLFIVSEYTNDDAIKRVLMVLKTFVYFLVTFFTILYFGFYYTNFPNSWTQIDASQRIIFENENNCCVTESIAKNDDEDDDVKAYVGRNATYFSDCPILHKFTSKKMCDRKGSTHTCTITTTEKSLKYSCIGKDPEQFYLHILAGVQCVQFLCVLWTFASRVYTMVNTNKDEDFIKNTFVEIVEPSDNDTTDDI
ncbi:hypothetical protein EIN_168280 [Entamoeba invadens IP1]|uniref:Uncharacterized protein n=1 Tax=Entamoeba invadens IP1 TaxID=370355 RepID=A0A0A1U0Q8_ENTIV|nr:hypothetical protein EIN_168280 [Entamoeba invadens IP1]ELP84463.1 hypothetical protein EIN_168280 [Entamoeba invadens IP1]|eukprot:XP_004183809.1 hypothetical protein EIN_168280 [Entamoeba invadens IP1]